MKRLSIVVFCLVVIGLVATITLSQAQEHDDHECEPEMTCGDQMATPKDPPIYTGPKSNQGGSKTHIKKGKGDNIKGERDDAKKDTPRREDPDSK